MYDKSTKQRSLKGYNYNQHEKEKQSKFTELNSINQSINQNHKIFELLNKIRSNNDKIESIKLPPPYQINFNQNFQHNPTTQETSFYPKINESNLINYKYEFQKIFYLYHDLISLIINLNCQININKLENSKLIDQILLILTNNCNDTQTNGHGRQINDENNSENSGYNDNIINDFLQIYESNFDERVGRDNSKNLKFKPFNDESVDNNRNSKNNENIDSTTLTLENLFNPKEEFESTIGSYDLG
ncbi:uncharacterized protein KGF55_004336 [Candida pseudojiufengensis]|uniref:uncharacterized protein n=1 Tax=Candida pseudojiufengensis TaxID=497109 RepID=UPI002224F3EA|nr:uncharacterized protein KGF55_004336 [Candida pseudojiufengensis]KAI5960766.1 hypothetical protein KGF55_004336 [Candida pseudojiufengensis]